MQYHGGVQYRGVCSTVGDILSTMGDVQYRGGYHDKCGGYLEYLGDTQYRGGVSISVVKSVLGQHGQFHERYVLKLLLQRSLVLSYQSHVYFH